MIVGIDNSRGRSDLDVKLLAVDRVHIFGTITLLFPVMVVGGVGHVRYLSRSVPVTFGTITVPKSMHSVPCDHFDTCQVQVWPKTRPGHIITHLTRFRQRHKSNVNIPLLLSQ